MRFQRGVAVEILSSYTGEAVDDVADVLADLMWRVGSEIARESVRVSEHLGHDTVTEDDVRLAATGLRIEYEDGEAHVTIRLPVEAVHMRHDDRDDALREEWESGGHIKRER